MNNMKLHEEPGLGNPACAGREAVMGRPRRLWLPPLVRKLAVANLLYPFLLVAAFYATWLAGRYELGHWPRPFFDDPGQIGGFVAVFDYATTFLLLAGLPAVCLSHAVAAALLFGKPEYRTRRAVLVEVLALVSLGVLFLFVRWDPQRVIEWYFD